MNEDPLPEPSDSLEVLPNLSTLHSVDGLPLFCQAWLPSDIPIASIVLVHGLGEHSGRYQHVANFFCQKGYAVFAIDLRGHGRSDGPRGHIDQFQDYLNDVKTLIAYVREQTPGLPRFLLGHSMGGVIALVYALTASDDIAAVIVSSAVLRNQLDVPGWKATLGNVLSLVSPTTSMPNGIDPNLLSRDEKVIHAYVSDPMVHDRVTARWFTEYMTACAWAMEEANTLAIPSLILQAGADQIADPSGSREFFDRIGLEDKYYIEYAGFQHELFNEPGPDALGVLGDVEAWLVPRAQRNESVSTLA